jgi:carbon-monoxide dehydrogenase medium subunit
VFPTSFTYHRAQSIEDAVAMLQQNPDAKILAGGHSLIPAMKLRLAAPRALVDIGRIAELCEIRVGDDVHIGAMVTYNEIRDHVELATLFPMLPEAISVVGDQQVRARGTLGGAIAHADPAADLTAVFHALNGRIKVTGPSGEREIAADDVFVDLWTTSLEPNELLTTIVIPRPSEGTKMAYAKHSHPASGYAVVGVAVVLAISDGSVSDARVVVTGATSRSARAAGAEAALIGQSLTQTTIVDAASKASTGLKINGDTYASEEYRAHLVNVITRRALEQAAAR